MAVNHIVLLQWKPDMAAAEIEAIFAASREFPKLIPGCIGATCGENFSTRSDGYTHVSTALFDSRAALEAYRTDPAHMRVVKMLTGRTARVLVVDYDC